MKKFKKLASLLLAAMMVLAMAIPAMATDPVSENGYTEMKQGKYTITIKDKPNHKFEAYQIFIGDTAKPDVGDDIKDVILSNIKFGSGITLAGKKALYEAYMSEAPIEESAYDDSENIRLLAQAIQAKNDGAALAEILQNSANIQSPKVFDEEPASDGGDSTYTATELDNGYYLVLDTINTSVTGADDAYSAYVIEVVGENVEVTPKKETPTVDKQVEDDDDTGYNNAKGENDGFGKTADHEIGESFQFKLIATLPKNADFNAYESYQLIFHDTLSGGISYDGEMVITVKKLEDETVVGTIPVDTGYKVVSNTIAAGTEITVTINDLKNYIGEGSLGDGYIVEVVYKAHLNDDALVTIPGKTTNPNPNKVLLEYSNNPNADGTGQTGKTPEKTVNVFTFEMPATKYADTVDKANILKGAGFTITPKDAKESLKFKWVDEEGAYYPSPDPDATDIITSNDEGIFTVKGLDVGEYTVTEKVTPPGFNTMDPFTIVITADHQEEAGAPVVNSKMTMDDKIVTKVDAINKKGATLPETGGIGTTIFYVLGSILVLGAVIVLVTKKRMSVEK